MSLQPCIVTVNINAVVIILPDSHSEFGHGKAHVIQCQFCPSKTACQS